MIVSGLHVPVLAHEEARGHLRGERRLELVQLGARDHVVGQVVAVLAHRRQAAQLGARVLGAASGVDHALLVQLELHAARLHVLDQVEHVVPELRDGARPLGVVVLVAVRPEPQDPGRQAAPLAGLEVERAVAIEERSHAVQGQARRRQRPGLRGAEPAAVGEGRARAHAIALDDRHVVVVPPQVVRTAEPGDAAAHHDDPTAHSAPPSRPAVTWSSIRMPGTANSQTMVVRAGRGGVK